MHAGLINQHRSSTLSLLCECQGVPTDDLLTFVFESLLDEHAVQQIKTCAPLLREFFGASTDKRRTQRAVLRGVTNLVTVPKHGVLMLKKTPAILMALYVEAPTKAPSELITHNQQASVHTLPAPPRARRTPPAWQVRNGPPR